MAFYSIAIRSDSGADLFLNSSMMFQGGVNASSTWLLTQSLTAPANVYSITLNGDNSETMLYDITKQSFLVGNYTNPDNNIITKWQIDITAPSYLIPFPGGVFNAGGAHVKSPGSGYSLQSNNTAPGGNVMPLHLIPLNFPTTTLAPHPTPSGRSSHFPIILGVGVAAVILIAMMFLINSKSRKGRK